MATLYRKQGQTQVVDETGNLQNFSGNLDTLPIYNNTITPDQLKPQTPLNLQSPNFDPSSADSLVSGAMSNNEQFQANYDRYLNASQNPSSDNSLQALLGDYLKASSENTGYGALQLDTEKQLGIPELQKQRASSQGTIKTALAEYNALKTQYDKQSADVEAGAGRKGLTTRAVMGQQGAIERAKLADLNNKAADIGILQAQDQALAGDIEAAQKTADRAVDLLYKDRESILATKKLNYELNKDLLEKTDAKRTKALEYALNKEEKAIEEEKRVKKDIQGLSLEAAKNGASSSIVSKIASAKSFEEAIRIGGAYMVDPLDRSIKAAQLRKLNTEISKINSEQQEAIVNSVVNEKDPTKLISNFFKGNPKIKTNQDINNAAAVVSSINEVAGSVGGGKIKGYGLFGGGFAPEFLKSQKGIENKAKISAVEGKLQQWLSGAALSKAQEKLVRKMVPERNDTDATVRTKLNQLTNYMLGDIKGRATAQGAQFEYIPVDLFSQPGSSVQPDTKTSVVSAISAGYEPTEVLDFVSQNYPDQAVKIQQARDAGYSEQEIIEYLSL